jgi:hypothetical protein
MRSSSTQDQDRNGALAVRHQGRCGVCDPDNAVISSKHTDKAPVRTQLTGAFNATLSALCNTDDFAEIAAGTIQIPDVVVCKPTIEHGIDHSLAEHTRVFGNTDIHNCRRIFLFDQRLLFCRLCAPLQQQPLGCGIVFDNGHPQLVIDLGCRVAPRKQNRAKHCRHGRKLYMHFKFPCLISAIRTSISKHGDANSATCGFRKIATYQSVCFCSTHGQAQRQQDAERCDLHDRHEEQGEPAGNGGGFTIKSP